MIAVVVQFTEMVVRKTSPVLYRLLGIFAAYHHQLCSARRGVAEYQSRAQFLAVGAVRFFRRYRFLAGDGALRRHPRTPCCG